MLISILDSAHSRPAKMGYTASTLDFFLREMVQQCKYQNNENTSKNTKIFFIKYLIELSFKLYAKFHPYQITTDHFCSFVQSHLKLFLKNAINIYIEGIIRDLIIIPVEHRIKHPTEKLTNS